VSEENIFLFSGINVASKNALCLSISPKPF
jgi:hypothetical protein